MVSPPNLSPYKIYGPMLGIVDECESELRDKGAVARPQYSILGVDVKKERVMSHFFDYLEETQRSRRSLLCVGLDPRPARMPVDDMAEFTCSIIDATADVVCAFKLNIAFFEAQGMEGLRALAEAVAAAKSRKVPVILDAKRGDAIAGPEYARATFEVWGVDAVTVNAWAGGESVEPFALYGDRGIYVWVRSSNPGGDELQMLEVNESPLYARLVSLTQTWNTRGNLGIVFGATHPSGLALIRAMHPSLPILIPGLGAQGGDLKESVRASLDSRGMGAIFNSSRDIIYASVGPDYADAARSAAMEFRDAINTARDTGTFG